MRRSRAAWAVAALVTFAAAAQACFPGATWQLLDRRHATLAEAPVNSFAWEATRLVPPSAWRHAPAAAPAEDARAAERDGLTPAQVSALSAMRAAPDSRWALAAAGALPPAVRLYAGGAVAFLHGNLQDAREYFHFVLALPPGQSAPRAAWAQYMLGRIAAKTGSEAEAETAFAAVRDLVVRGAADPLDLATASLGEQARLVLAGGDVAGAVALYAEQAADGSAGAVQSLRMVAERAMKQPDTLPALVGQPLVQRLLVVHALGLTGDYLHHQWIGRTDGEDGVDGFGDPAGMDIRPLSALLAAIRASPAPVAAGDRLAALAYGLGDTRTASDLAGRLNTPLALWIRAKLGLEYGRDAAPLFAAALHAAQTKTGAAALEPSSVGLLRGETAVATLNHGDFMQAAEVLWPVAGVYWGDFAYLAERVLTADDLRRFVTAHAPDPDPGEAGQGGQGFSAVQSIRSLLARRLVREGRIAEALPFIDPSRDPADATLRQDAQALAEAMRAAGTAFWAIDRARAAWSAAGLLRHRGMALMGTEEAPDQAYVGGDFAWWLGPGPAGPFADPDGGATQAEQIRYDFSRARPDLRFHYRYLAIDRALATTADLPGRSQAFAAILCQAAGWSLGLHDAERARALWRLYVTRGARVPFATHFGRGCPAPDFDGVWRTRRMLAQDAIRSAAHGHKWPIAAAGALAVLASGWLVLRPKRQAT